MKNDITLSKQMKVIVARDTDTSYEPVRSVDSQLKTVSTPLTHEIAKGNIPDFFQITKFGHNSAVAGTLEEVWDGSEVYVYMTSASTLYISSSNDGDDQVYEVQGLDANWNLQTVEVTASGFTFVPLTGTWIRVFRVKNLGATDNAGTIYISDNNTDVGGNGVPDDLDDVKAQIQPLFNQTLMAIYSVPRNSKGFLTCFYVSTSSRAATEAHLYVRPFGGVFQIKKIITIFEGTATIDYTFPLNVLPKSDVVIKAMVSGGGGDVSAGFDLWFEPV